MGPKRISSKERISSRAAKACKAVNRLGISNEISKQALNKLLELYDHNWELIEDENYRVLLDAIFDANESKKVELQTEADVQEPEDSEPLFRKSSHQSSSAVGAVGSGTSLKRLHFEDGSSQTHCSQKPVKLTRFSVDEIETEIKSSPASPQQYARVKRRKCDSPQGDQFEDGAELSQLRVSQRARISSCHSSQSHALVPLSPQLPSGENGSNCRREAQIVCFQEQYNVAALSPKSNVPINSDENADGMSQFLVPISMIRPDVPTPAHDDFLRKNDLEFVEDASQFVEDNNQNVDVNINKDESPNSRCSKGKMDCPAPDPCSYNGKDGSKITRCSGGPNVDEDNFLDKACPDVAAVGNKGLKHRLQDVHDTSCRNQPCEDASNVSNFDIVSSSEGEVKISMIYNSSQKSGLRIPSINSVLRIVEEQCLKAYRITEPSFSVMNLMRDICECFLAVCSSNDDSQMDTPGLGLSEGSIALNGLNSRGYFHGDIFHPATFSDGSFKFQNLINVTSQIPRIVAPDGFGFLQCITGLNSAAVAKFCGSSHCWEHVTNGLQSSPHSHMLVVQKRQSCHNAVPHYLSDVSWGAEEVEIPLLNGIDTLPLPAFHYISRNIVYKSANVQFSLDGISEADCCPDCFGNCLSFARPCACAHETGGEFAYMPGGILKEKFLEECIRMKSNLDHHLLSKDYTLERSNNQIVFDPCKEQKAKKFIKECWFKCGCLKQCGNRVVQRGVTTDLQVFLTPEGKGWGLQTLEGLPKGAFICEYVGEILTNSELNEEITRRNGLKYRSPVLLDANWRSDHVLKDEKPIYLDATYYGNVARFINHRCFDANLIEIPVAVETTNHHYYRLALFTRRNVDAMEELTWDYGINFSNQSPLAKEFKCLCRSKYCRDVP